MTDIRDALMTGRKSDGSSVQRPLSPHLQVYRPQITSVLSIFHRITGVGLGLGTLLLVWWLVAAAASDGAYDTVSWFMRTPIGWILLIGWSIALWFHFCNGIRHLFWDFDQGFEIAEYHRSGKAVVVATVVLTVLTWLIAIVS